MGILRRNAVILTAVAGSLMSCASPPSSPEAAAVEVKNLDKPGAFEVRTNGIAVASRGEIEELVGQKWIVAVPYRLFEKCPEKLSQSCITGKDKILPVPWTGYSCSSQCEVPCKKNVYRGPGEFRLVVFSCDRKRRFESPVFKMPADSKP